MEERQVDSPRKPMGIANHNHIKEPGLPSLSSAKENMGPVLVTTNQSLRRASIPAKSPPIFVPVLWEITGLGQNRTHLFESPWCA